MPRNGSVRPLLVALGLFVSLFAIGVRPALATHFRYGTISWERDLTYTSTTPNEVKVRVTLDVGMRWSYPYGQPQVLLPGMTRWTGQCAAGYGTTFGTGPGGCPPVGFAVALIGSSLQGFKFSQAVKLTAIDGIALTAPVILPAGSTYPITGIVNQILQAQDIFYGRYTVDIVFVPQPTPLKVSWEDAARISTLLDGNNDLNWKLETAIDATAGKTKSPKSVSSAVVQVATGQANTVTLPVVTFDNTVPRFRFATTLESDLARPVPLNSQGQPAMTLNADTGVVTFTPRTSGVYAVQFKIGAYNPATGVVENEVPLDLLFEAAPPSATYSLTLAPVDGETVNTATVPVPFSYAVRATLAPANPAYTVTINHGVLPAGATFSQLGTTGAAPVTGTFNWTPQVDSTAAAVCYTATATNGQTLVAITQNQLCITTNLEPLETNLTAFPVSGAGGGPLVLSAKLTRTLDGAPLPGRSVRFAWTADPINPPWVSDCTNGAITGPDGVASCVVTTTHVTPPGGGSYTAIFDPIANELLQSSAASSTVVIKAASTSLDAPIASTTPYNSVGYPVTVSAVLNRIFTDGGIYAPPGAVVQFTLTDPNGKETVLNGAVAGTHGVATVTFPADAAPVLGDYKIKAFFPESDLLIGNVSSPETTFAMGQRVKLTVAPVTTGVNVPTRLRARLTDDPQDTPLAGKLITFKVGTTTLQGTTGVDGWAQTLSTVTFPSLGDTIVTASYAPDLTLDELNSQGLRAAETANGTVSVTPASPTSMTLTPVNGTSGQTATLQAHLTTASGAAVSGETVTFSLVGGGALGSPVATDVNGDASVTVMLGDAFTGTYQVNYSGRANVYLASSAAAGFTIVKAATQLTVDAPPSTALVGGQVVVSATLIRTSAPAGAVSTAPVTFTLTGASTNPDGATTTTATVMTDAAGKAIATLAVPARGQFTVTASYAGTGSLLPATANASTALTVYQKTHLVVNATHGFAGDVTDVSASLRTLPQDTAVAGETVSFSFTGNPTPANPSVTTGENGVVVTSTNFPDAGTFTATASFQNLANFFVDQDGNQLPATADADVTIGKADTTLSALTLPSTAFVGDTATVVTRLTRVTSPAGAVANAAVDFTLASADGSQQATATTAADGSVSASFELTARGPAHASAAYAGTSGLNATSAAQDLTVYQKTQLTLSAPSTVAAGATATIAATLRTLPGNQPIAGQMVTLDFGGAQPTQTLQTDASGSVSATLTIANPSTVNASASFANVADHFANRAGGLAAEGDSAAITVTAAPTTLSAITVPGSALVGGDVTAEVVLSRTDGLALPSGLDVNFTIDGPSGQQQIAAAVDAAGHARATFTPTVRDVHTITATFAGTTTLVGSSAPASTVNVYQRALLTMAATQATIAGVSTDIVATLTAGAGGAPIANAPVTFVITSDGVTISAATVITDSNGVATRTVTLDQSGDYAVQGSFLDAAGFYTNSAGALPPSAEIAQGALNVAAAATVLSDISAPASAIVDGSIVATATLSRTDGIALAPNRAIVFTITGPAGTSTQTVQADASGHASASFTPAARGIYTVSASFAGDTALKPAAAAHDAAVTVYQPATLALPASVAAFAARGVAISATLKTSDGAPIAGQQVTFTFSGAGTPGPVTVTTDGSGVAAASVTFAQVGTFTVQASFSNASDFFTDGAGTTPPVPATASTTVVVSKSDTTTSVASSLNPAVQTQSVTFTATVSGVNGSPAPTGAVTFLLDGTVALGTATVSPAGTATVTTAALPTGSHAVTAAYSGDAIYNGSTSAPLSQSVTPSNTQSGTGVSTSPVDATTGAPSPITLTFANVTVPGISTVTSQAGGPPPPSGFKVNGVYYDISTTAQFSGAIEVCFSFTRGKPRLFHYTGGKWVDITTSYPSPGVVCGTTTSLSPFALFDSPAQQLVDTLTDIINGSRLPGRSKEQLLALVQQLPTVIEHLTPSQRGKELAKINAVSALIHHLRAQRQITDAQAAQWVALLDTLAAALRAA